jgi:hypothetical protein
MGYIDAEQVRRLASALAGSSYGDYVLRIPEQPSIAPPGLRLRETSG